LNGDGTVAITQPDKPKFTSIISSDSAQNITVINNGNAAISPDNIHRCKPANTGRNEVLRQFLLPCRTFEIKHKAGFKTSFTLIEGSNKSNDLVIASICFMGIINNPETHQRITEYDT
jgi:hypothetical protein